MKILQLWAPYRERGGEEFIVNLAGELLGKNHEVETCLFDLDSLLDKPLGAVSALTSFFYNAKSLEDLEKMVETFRPDVVLSHNIMPAGSYAVYRWLEKRGIPVAYYVHNFRPYSVNGYCWADGRLAGGGFHLNYLQEIIHGAWQNSVMRTGWYALALWYSHLAGIWHGIDRWIMISEFMAKAMAKGGVPTEKMSTLLHPWVNTGVEPPAGPSGEGPVLLFLGRISEEKGIRVLLDAWRRVEKSGAPGKLLIAGGGPLVPWVEEQCATLERAFFVGYADAAMKRKLFAEAWALVVPSVWWEPLGLVVYESYQYGRPVLAARSGGLEETVEHGSTGWLHTPGDVEALTSQILEAFSDPERTRQLGTQGQAWLRENADADDWLLRMENILRETIAGKKTAPQAGILPASPAAARAISGAGATPAPARSSGRQIELVAYLADQNPGHDRSFGISRMSETVLSELGDREDCSIHVIASSSSQKGPANIHSRLILPLQTRGKISRLLVDHLHPLAARLRYNPDIWYYPKGFLPMTGQLCRPSVITIHDTIIQYYRDHYPSWRKNAEYSYWARMLKHTLESADCILTVSQCSKRQILDFMKRYDIPPKEITVTYEPCLYESVPQPVESPKDHYVIHLASTEPHKRTAQLVNWWLAFAGERDLPPLHLIGALPPGTHGLIENSPHVISRPFLKDADLQTTLMAAKALILPSEVEGFGLPAIEAYYLGTPVCHVKDTSVEEILGVATQKGRFSLDDRDSLLGALEEVLAMAPAEVRECGLTLRQHYSADSVAEKMMHAFRETLETRGQANRPVP